ncbi:hypothetical protein D3C73_738510 [compost metagenome]
MNSANSGIKQGFNGGVCMCCGTAVVRVINHGSDTRINRAQRRQEITDIDICGPIVFRKREVRGIAIVVQTGGVWVDAAQLAFPGVTMRIDHPRHGNHICGINDVSTLGVQVLTDGGDG